MLCIDNVFVLCVDLTLTERTNKLLLSLIFIYIQIKSIILYSETLAYNFVLINSEQYIRWYNLKDDIAIYKCQLLKDKLNVCKQS